MSPPKSTGVSGSAQPEAVTMSETLKRTISNSNFNYNTSNHFNIKQLINKKIIN